MNWYKTASKGWQQGDSIVDSGDVQRYLYDAYQGRVFITNLAGKKITVSVSLFFNHTGTCMWQDFWRFDTGDEKTARKCFAEADKACRKVFDLFKNEEIPTPMLYTYLRNAVLPLYPENRPTSRSIVLDESKRNETVTDWRSSIYGTRYPESDGF
jgi:hypothetical protein